MSFGFGMRAFKKFPELIPLCTIMTGAMVGATGFVIYALATKPDVRINKLNNIPPWEKVGPTEHRKMVVMNDPYEMNPEREKLRKEMGMYRF